VPRICEFNGIEIYMYHDDHPWPHFHVRYAEFEASVRIDTLKLTGRLPPRVERMVREWTKLRSAELMANAVLAAEFGTLTKIEPPSRR
jgi:hypothetical protein